MRALNLASMRVQISLVILTRLTEYQLLQVYVYVDALRALVADRHDIVTGQENELIKHEMLVALKQAKDGQGHFPELLKQLISVRNKLKPPKDLGSVRGMVVVECFVQA